jgi:predicted MFS family arabinose efflux permease
VICPQGTSTEFCSFRDEKWCTGTVCASVNRLTDRGGNAPAVHNRRAGTPTAARADGEARADPGILGAGSAVGAGQRGTLSMGWAGLGHGARISPERLQSRAVTIALAGTPISLVLGVPVGTWLGTFGGWQVAFYASAVLALLNTLWVAVTLPSLPGLPVDQHRLSRVLAIPGLRTILFALTAYMVAHNTIYTYVTDFLRYANDHHLRKLVVSSTVLFAVTVLVLAVLSGVPVLVYVAVAAWGFAFGSSPSLFIHGAISATGEAVHVAQWIVISFFSASIALGGFLGGVLVDNVGTGSITWASLALLVAAAVAVIAGRRHAFPRSA